MARLVTILCPGGDTEEVDLDLAPMVAKRVDDGALSIVEKPKAAKAKEKPDQDDEA